MSSARILHISDLHQGMGQQKVLMPAFKKALLDDFKEVADIAGHWQLVVFSGDLVQSGKRQEYEDLEVFLLELWDCFGNIGFEPRLFCVPGNHDLVRPDPSTLAAKAFAHWWDGGDPSGHLFGDKEDYKGVVSSAFSGYVDWIARTKVPFVDLNTGVLPGDSCSTLDIDGLKVGVVGLNSAWLHLFPEDLKGRLHVDPRQLLGVCPDPDNWSERHDLTLLVTHHPLDWLHKDSQLNWRSEIDTHVRFDSHLHGHMHDQALTALQHGGGVTRRAIQASSLFGLEKAGPRGIHRRHGYSVLSYDTDMNPPQVSFFPRIGKVIAGGQHKLVPDVDMGLDRQGSIRMPVRKRDRSASSSDCLTKVIAESVSSTLLPSLRRVLPEAGAWVAVRKVERESALALLKTTKRVWLKADWGMGGEYFISAMRQELDLPSAYFHVECDVWGGAEEIRNGIRDACGGSLEEVCEALSSAGPGILLLDDSSNVRPDDDSALAIISIMDIISDFCPSLKIVVRSRLSAPRHMIGEVALRLLDEVDSATYIREWRGGKHATLDEHSLESLVRHSGGSAARLESLLEDFEMFDIADLASLNPDLDSAVDREGRDASPIITSELIKIRGDEHLSRAFDLLSALAMFPRGEVFESIRRFNGSKGFHAQDVKELHRRALLDVSEVTTLSGKVDKVLFVPTPVRDAVLGLMSPADFSRNSNKAIEAYFGSEWVSKGLASSKVRFDNAGCPSWQIANASALIHRMARSSVQEGGTRPIASCVRLAHVYAAALEKGDHFRSNVAFLEETLPLLRSAGAKKACDELALFLAKSLRMVGRHQESLDTSSGIDIDGLPKSSKQVCHYCDAESLLSLGQVEDARSRAKQAIAVQKDSAVALQSHALLLNAGEAGDAQVVAIEKKARKKKYAIVARNIAISRADAMANEEARKVLREVQLDARSGKDSYNCVRASIRLARLQLNSCEAVDDVTFNILIEGYQLFHSDGSNNLFDKITAVLWEAFGARGDPLNQISLFRHSSLRWRLRGSLKIEGSYVERLQVVLDRLRIEGLLGRADVIYVTSRLG